MGMMAIKLKLKQEFGRVWWSPPEKPSNQPLFCMVDVNQGSPASSGEKMYRGNSCWIMNIPEANYPNIFVPFGLLRDRRRRSSSCCRAATMWSAASTARFVWVEGEPQSQWKILDISTKTKGLLRLWIKSPKKCRRSCRKMTPGMFRHCCKVLQGNILAQYYIL